MPGDPPRRQPAALRARTIYFLFIGGVVDERSAQKPLGFAFDVAFLMTLIFIVVS